MTKSLRQLCLECLIFTQCLSLSVSNVPYKIKDGFAIKTLYSLSKKEKAMVFLFEILHKNQ